MTHTDVVYIALMSYGRFYAGVTTNVDMRTAQHRARSNGRTTRLSRCRGKDGRP